jgi:dihydrofolate synthase/folylpolyglutamate synthase
MSAAERAGSPPPAQYAAELAWLYGMQGLGIKLGLEKTRLFLKTLQWEQGAQRVLHVAGTNGKGSVCAMLESICRAGGLTTGMFTSPHLVTFRERIRLNGEMAAREEIAEDLAHIREVCAAMETPPTFFEITTALAFQIFARARPDVVILETGLGGRLDSTNVIRPLVSVIASVGMDHMHILGGTLAEIAWEKAGIIKEGIPVVTGPLAEEAAEVVARIARERNAPLIQMTEALTGVEIGLKGEHQRMNAAVAVRALEAAGLEFTRSQVAEGLRAVQWPGRFQWVQYEGRQFILDGAHNADAVRTLVATWRETYGDARPRIILGIVRDKDAAAICGELADIAAEFVVVPVRNPRGGLPEDLRHIASQWALTSVCPTLVEAIANAPAGATPTLITGSLFLIGEALVALGVAEASGEVSVQ